MRGKLSIVCVFMVAFLTFTWHSMFDDITDMMDMSLRGLCCSPWGGKESDTTEQLN